MLGAEDIVVEDVVVEEGVVFFPVLPDSLDNDNSLPLEIACRLFLSFLIIGGADFLGGGHGGRTDDPNATPGGQVQNNLVGQCFIIIFTGILKGRGTPSGPITTPLSSIRIIVPLFPLWRVKR